jgi:large subunit ribosomal protein L19
MAIKTESLIKSQLKKDLPDIRPGDLIRVHQQIKEGEKQRKQVFEGIVIAKKHGKGITATITVRKEIKGIGMEKTFPLHSPLIEKIEVMQKHKVRRAKLYYLRKLKGKKAKLKRKEEKK